jgi:hypothetical protein
MPPLELLLSTMDLISHCTIALQKRQEDLAWLKAHVHQVCTQAALKFERQHAATIHDFNFKHEDLVLVQNTAIEKALNWKMWPRYFEPMIIVSRNKGGTYIICDLDGTLLHAPVTAFWVVPYLAQ